VLCSNINLFSALHGFVALVRRLDHPTGRVLVWSVLLGLAVAEPAAAQIYSWRDANGNLVLSDHAQEGVTDLRSYPVPHAEALRTTRVPSTDRSRQYDDIIDQQARLQDIRPDLVRAVVQVESGFNPFARSPKGALGLMQLMPATIRQFGVRNPFNPGENVRAGVAYLRRLLDRYENNEQLALAAYNAGPEAVDRHGRAVPPYRETRQYVAQIHHLALAPPTTQAPTSSVIYRIIEIVDGRPVARYTDRKPASGAYEVVGVGP
jgi:hypothetical protein